MSAGVCPDAAGVSTIWEGLANWSRAVIGKGFEDAVARKITVRGDRDARESGMDDTSYRAVGPAQPRRARRRRRIVTDPAAERNLCDDDAEDISDL